MRLFIAIKIPDNVKDYLFSIKSNFNKEVAKINWVAKKNLHITLKFLGNVDNKLISIIIEKLTEIKFKDFELELDNLGIFPNENYIRVLWVGVKNFNKVIELQQDIENKLRDYFKNEKEFSSHLTIGRIKFIRDKYDFKETIKKIKIEKIRFNVNNFSLVKSELSMAGPKYTDVGTFYSS